MTTHTRLSKFISMVLRHRAHEFGLELDAEGYADIGALYEVIQQRYKNEVTYDDLIRVVTTPGSDHKMRFELQGYRVRARYGHNASITPVRYEPATPPAILYHGTVVAALTGIRREGLLPQKRQYVHLAVEPNRAMDVGSRRGEPLLLSIRAREAHDEGVLFFQPDETHFLAYQIPAAFINFPEDD